MKHLSMHILPSLQRRIGMRMHAFLLTAVAATACTAQTAVTVVSTFTDSGLSVADGELRWTSPQFDSADEFEGEGSLYGRGARSGNGNANIVLTCTDAAELGQIQRIDVEASTNGDKTVMSAAVGGNAFGSSQQILQGTAHANSTYTFEGTGEGTIVLTTTRNKSAGKQCRLWLRSIAVTYLPGETAIAAPSASPSSKASSVICDLAGRQWHCDVSLLPRGCYIVGGRKILIR